MLSSNPLLTGILAGIASGLLFVAASLVGVFAALLMLISPLPVYLAALAWGGHAGLAATVTAIAVSVAAAGLPEGISFGAIVAVPALLFGHQANLAQPAGEDGSTMIWYPLDRLLFNLAIAIGAAAILIGIVEGYSIDTIAPKLEPIAREFMRSNPDFSTMGDEAIVGMARFSAGLVPFMFSCFWLVIHVVNAHVSVRIARASGLMPRPRDDIPRDANLPGIALIVLPVAMIIMSVTSGAISHIAAVFSGSLFMAFCLVGLAWLHYAARKNGAMGMLLITSYVLIILLAFVLFMFVIPGMMRCFSRLAPPARQNNSE